RSGLRLNSSTGSLPRTTASSGSPQSLVGTGGRGGFLSEDDSEWSMSLFTTSADLKTLGLGREALLGGAGAGSGVGKNGRVVGARLKADDRSMKRRGPVKLGTGLKDARKVRTV
ncbi:unnamed protein product, partial [Sphacelaria rigidula]